MDVLYFGFMRLFLLRCCKVVIYFEFVRCEFVLLILEVFVCLGVGVLCYLEYRLRRRFFLDF